MIAAPNLTKILCHMDIAPRNIIIDNRGVIGLLDWGCAGFYPASFETWSIVLEARLRDHPIAADLSSLSLDTATLVEHREISALDKVFSANQRVALYVCSLIP